MAKLGKRVLYRDSQGFEKLAFVTATRSTVAKGTGVARPDKGSVHLHIISPTGKQYDRTNIPLGDGPRSYSLI